MSFRILITIQFDYSSYVCSAVTSVITTTDLPWRTGLESTLFELQYLLLQTPKMTSLRLPPNATAILERCYHSNADLGEWLVYRAPSIPANDIPDLCYLAMKAYNDRYLREPESEFEEQSFIKPAHEAKAHESIKDVLDAHISMLERILDEGSKDPWNKYRIYPLGFIMVSECNWHEKGVVVVHCDKDRGVWKVGQCRILAHELGHPLTNLIDTEESFDETRQRPNVIDEGCTSGGTVPIGEWQYTVFSTVVGHLAGADEVIYDPRGDSYPPEETTFDLVPSLGMSWKKVLEAFVLEYAKCVREPVLPEGRERPLKRHPELFLVVDCARPERDGVLVARMVWDGDVEKPESELREAASKSRAETRRSDANSVLSTLRDLDHTN